jgi:hypothetical protein
MTMQMKTKSSHYFETQSQDLARDLARIFFDAYNV